MSYSIFLQIISHAKKYLAGMRCECHRFHVGTTRPLCIKSLIWCQVSNCLALGLFIHVMQEIMFPYANVVQISLNGVRKRLAKPSPQPPLPRGILSLASPMLPWGTMLWALQGDLSLREDGNTAQVCVVLKGQGFPRKWNQILKLSIILASTKP